MCTSLEPKLEPNRKFGCLCKTHLCCRVIISVQKVAGLVPVRNRLAFRFGLFLYVALISGFVFVCEATAESKAVPAETRSAWNSFRNGNQQTWG